MRRQDKTAGNELRTQPDRQKYHQYCLSYTNLSLIPCSAKLTPGQAQIIKME